MDTAEAEGGTSVQFARVAANPGGGGDRPQSDLVFKKSKSGRYHLTTRIIALLGLEGKTTLIVAIARRRRSVNKVFWSESLHPVLPPRASLALNAHVIGFKSCEECSFVRGSSIHNRPSKMTVRPLSVVGTRLNASNH